MCGDCRFLLYEPICAIFVGSDAHIAPYYVNRYDAFFQNAMIILFPARVDEGIAPTLFVVVCSSVDHAFVIPICARPLRFYRNPFIINGKTQQGQPRLSLRFQFAFCR